MNEEVPVDPTHVPVDAVTAAREGLVAIRHERYPEALALLQAASTAAPDWAVPVAYASSVLVALGRPVDAQDSIERALELSPDGFASNQKAGELCIRLGQLELAEDHFLAAVRAAANGSDDQRAAQKSLEYTREHLRKSITLGSRLPDLGRFRAWFRMPSRGRRPERLVAATVEVSRD